jgi:hypothetical protein
MHTCEQARARKKLAVCVAPGGLARSPQVPGLQRYGAHPFEPYTLPEDGLPVLAPLRADRDSCAAWCRRTDVFHHASNGKRHPVARTTSVLGWVANRIAALHRTNPHMPSGLGWIGTGEPRRIPAILKDGSALTSRR